MNLTLSLTHACNLACTYCYGGAKRHAVMSWDVVRRAVDIGAAAARGTLTVGFFGGEPLLAWDL
ncbi:MAG: radical SAM protein, partial [Deltaproteobacteria bacterium]|nr:radical SAM protein [Deltaproteobacteria bacterium]